MDDAEFQDLLDAHGDDLRLWPATRRLEAERHLVASPEAQASYLLARMIRASVADAPVRAPKGLADRICAAAFSAPAVRASGR
ncbi:MAG: hypothetical protein P4L98_10025 [Ancalomicrobiaceae bacterium]|nr:hypothetical protein [Ancalomicrobiaceae bacterium]